VSFLGIDDYREARRQFEISFIKGKLRDHDGNITRTPAAIGLHRQSIQEKLRDLGIQTEKVDHHEDTKTPRKNKKQVAQFTVVDFL